MPNTIFMRNDEHFAPEMSGFTISKSDHLLKVRWKLKGIWNVCPSPYPASKWSQIVILNPCSSLLHTNAVCFLALSHPVVTSVVCRRLLAVLIVSTLSGYFDRLHGMTPGREFVTIRWWSLSKKSVLVVVWSFELLNWKVWLVMLTEDWFWRKLVMAAEHLWTWLIRFWICTFLPAAWNWLLCLIISVSFAHKAECIYSEVRIVLPICPSDKTWARTWPKNQNI